MQAAGRTFFVPPPPQSRSHVTPQLFVPGIPALRPSPTVYSTAHVGATLNRAAPGPDNRHTTTWTPHMGHVPATAITTPTPPVTFDLTPSTQTSSSDSTVMSVPEDDASSRLLLPWGGATDLPATSDASVSPTVLIDAAIDSPDDGSPSEMSMLDCLAPRASDVAAAMQLHQQQAAQNGRPEAEEAQSEAAALAEEEVSWPEAAEGQGGVAEEEEAAAEVAQVGLYEGAGEEEEQVRVHALHEGQMLQWQSADLLAEGMPSDTTPGNQFSDPLSHDETHDGHTGVILTIHFCSLPTDPVYIELVQTTSSSNAINVQRHTIIWCIFSTSVMLPSLQGAYPPHLQCIN